MRKRELAALAICLVMLLTMGCAARSASDTAAARPESEVAYEEAAAAPMEAGAGNGYALSDQSKSQQTSGEMQDADVRKIVYTADMTLTADNPETALNTLIEACKELGGYVSGSYATTDDLGAYYATATLKVPADSLEALVTKAEAAGKVDDYRLGTDDISLSYYDIQARLSNAKAEEKQLLEILDKCETIEDILKVRESLTRVRADIESYTAQINLWDTLVDYATLNVMINRTPRTAVEGEKELIEIWKASDVWNKMARGFQNSARFVVNALGAIAIFLAIALVPAGILFLCIGLPIILHKKKKRRKAAELAEQAELPAQDGNPEQKNE